MIDPGNDPLFPAIRQMHDAEDDHRRALILLQVPDAVLMKYREAFEGACRRAGFYLGLSFIGWRRASWHATRGPDGRLRGEDFDRVREAFATFAQAGGGR